jgi:23S rRNA pseudouridine2605 synthase
MKLVKKAVTKSNAGRVPLYRALSKLGKASREEAKAMILAGKIKVHGAVEINPNRMINPDRAHIEIAGTKAVKEIRRLILFHKPVGYLTTKRDPEGRPTIYDLLPNELHSFHPVGRLDQHTSGLLLLTNSTKISHFLTDPKNKIPRTYIVQVRGLVTIEIMNQMKKGIIDRDEQLQFHEVVLLKSSHRESKLEVVLLEGKYREIRRMCSYFEHEVQKLKRVSFGEFELGSIPSGGIHELETSSVESMI